MSSISFIQQSLTYYELLYFKSKPVTSELYSSNGTYIHQNLSNMATCIKGGGVNIQARSGNYLSIFAFNLVSQKFDILNLEKKLKEIYSYEWLYYTGYGVYKNYICPPLIALQQSPSYKATKLKNYIHKELPMSPSFKASPQKLQMSASYKATLVKNYKQRTTNVPILKGHPSEKL